MFCWSDIRKDEKERRERKKKKYILLFAKREKRGWKMGWGYYLP